MGKKRRPGIRNAGDIVIQRQWRWQSIFLWESNVSISSIQNHQPWEVFLDRGAVGKLELGNFKWMGCDARCGVDGN
jgi:hypothetical protein